MPKSAEYNCGYKDGSHDGYRLAEGDIKEELRSHIKCSEITIKGMTDFLNNMRVVTYNGRVYRGVPGSGYVGRWEYFYNSAWYHVDNYQIRIELNKIAGSAGEDETG